METNLEYQSFFQKVKIEISNNLEYIIKSRDNFSKKLDGSYVSKGDMIVNELIKQACLTSFNDFVYVSEEDFDADQNWNKMGDYIFVDPIDGTENFVSGLKEWGVGISIYSKGRHISSFMYFPELYEIYLSGMPQRKFQSRLIGLSSSVSVGEIGDTSINKLEARISGCSMYNMFNAARGSFRYYENVKGVNCWDILPGLNMCIELGRVCFVDNQKYSGEILFPTKKYKVRVC